ncbi:hypothetical protein FHU10_2686 [Serratia fonticola]|uniref:Uncharacterized protein n=1 Tax=Serratia fonticola TaxID=47917 RepID=A0A542BUX6_SERFO|nr:hypothetical protein [Serratia fonticola]TQI82342.1 hypothetical protein FHU09_5022 [Serratia fonticola]TQI95638.1 hypothetical protein FHU11_1027 [Serratia fonticola]TVZ70134.1 hypothetical protein FHU10_2686 [Serratia fonticola]
MSYTYSLFSILSMVPLFLIVKRLTSSDYPYTRFYAILVASLFMLFHIYVFNFQEIPVLGIAVPEDNEFMSYAPYLYGLLTAAVCAVAHNKSKN